MADEPAKENEAPKENADAAKDAKKDPAAEGGAAAKAPGKKSSALMIGVGGGAAAIVGMAYFLAVAAVHTADAANIPPGFVKVEEADKNNPDGTAKPGEENKAEGSHGEAGHEEKKEGEKKEEGGHEEKKEGEKKEGGHGEAPKEGGHGEAAEGGHGEGGHGEGAEAPKAEPVKRYQKLDEIKINPNQTGMKRFLLVQFGIAVDGENAEDGAKKLQDEEVKARIKDALIQMLRNKKVDELEGDANMKILKGEVRRVVEKYIIEKDQDIKVVAVLFEQFIVQ